MELRKYQDETVNLLVEKTINLLSKNRTTYMSLQSPTGSGKTIMMAEYIRKLVSDNSIEEDSLSFVWVAPLSLHIQSKDKLTNYFENEMDISCCYFYDLTNYEIKENQILFLNWSSINKEDVNTIVIENEKNFYLQKVIDNTLEKGRNIILIIDESHTHASTEISNNLINDIKPKLVINVSATPNNNINIDEIVKVDIEEVINSGLIKKSVIINSNFKNELKDNTFESELKETSNSLVLEAALKKREDLINSYSKENSKVNPLLLIQIPDNTQGYDENLEPELFKKLKEHDITLENGKLSIYLSENKENFLNISENDNEVQVLIFKQGLSLGWDCPRSQILVLFREHMNITFSIQTIGRIMRMPEPDIGHYASEDINMSYVYTNVNQINIIEDVAKGYFTIYNAKRSTNYSNLNLISYYKPRFREKTRLNPTFDRFYQEAASRYNLKSKIDLSKQNIDIEIIEEHILPNINLLMEDTPMPASSYSLGNEIELQKIFDQTLILDLSPHFYPEQVSIGRLKTSIYNFFENNLNLSYDNDFEKIIRAYLSSNNHKHFHNVSEEAKELYIKNLNIPDNAIEEVRYWEVPLEMQYNGNFTIKNYKKSIIQPYYQNKKVWRTEEKFIEYLEKSTSVHWWFKNKDNDMKYFAIPYKEDNKTKLFYIDFIIKTNDNKIYIFDTKSGITLKTSLNKIDGISDYLQIHNNVKAGIVTNTDSREFTGRWVYFSSHSGSLSFNDFNNWHNLPF